MTTVTQKCLCGCGRTVLSKRSDALYASSACRVRALRKRARYDTALDQLAADDRETVVRLVERYGGDGLQIEECVKEIVVGYGSAAATLAIHLVALAANCEYGLNVWLKEDV